MSLLGVSKHVGTSCFVKSFLLAFCFLRLSFSFSGLRCPIVWELSEDEDLTTVFQFIITLDLKENESLDVTMNCLTTLFGSSVPELVAFYLMTQAEVKHVGIT